MNCSVTEEVLKKQNNVLMGFHAYILVKGNAKSMMLMERIYSIFPIKHLPLPIPPFFWRASTLRMSYLLCSLQKRSENEYMLLR